MYTTRIAHSADLDVLPAIEHDAAQLFASTTHREIARETPSTVAEFQSWLDRDALFVAVSPAGDLVGFAIAFPVDGNAHLHEIDVHRAHSRRGVGRQLIEFVKAWAVQRSYDRLTLSTFRDVPWNAPYYTRLGFAELPEADAGSELKDMRERERANGLNVEHRLFMVLTLAQPN